MMWHQRGPDRVWSERSSVEGWGRTEEDEEVLGPAPTPVHFILDHVDELISPIDPYVYIFFYSTSLNSPFMGCYR